jgi:arabinogalactan endo-1,4-beta-galactosidase
MEDCGAVYTVSGDTTDVYTIFKDRGCNLVRLRLWHTPAWYDQLNSGDRYSDFEDLRKSIQRAKLLEMEVLLAFHLSDTWADPAHQVVPAAWAGIVDSLTLLTDSLYQYIYSTLYALAQDSLLPDIVQIGNETNKGILQSQEQNDGGWALHWPKNRMLFNGAIDAVRDIEAMTGQGIKIALHIAHPADVDWMLGQFWDNGVQDFDMIGISWYPAYHGLSISTVGNIMTGLQNTYPGKEIVFLETGYPWTMDAYDAANNIINSGVTGYGVSPSGQKQWLVDFAQMVLDKGGKGIVYWEPAWVSTACSTQWAQGSHWENCTFFDYDNDLLVDGGIGWMGYAYDFPSAVSELEEESSYFEITHHGNEIFFFQKEYLASDESFVMQLSDFNGRRMWHHEFMLEGKGSCKIFNVGPVGPGVYLITVSSGPEWLLVKKIVVL